ncbi:MAG: glycosyltransferase family 4 protein [Kiritimatiellia bacterium]
MNSRILVVSHQASRTGAPFALLHFLRWLRTNTNLDFEVLLQEDGPLRKDFEAVGKTVVDTLLERRVKRNLGQRILRKVGLAYQDDYRFDPLVRTFRKGEIGLVYANTVANVPLLVRLQYLNAPLLLHVHEMEFTIRRHGGWHQMHCSAACYIAASQAVKDNLIERYGIPAERIHVVHEFIPVDCVLPSANARCQVRERLGIPQEAVVVGGVGADWWRKGGDLFLQVAHRVRNLEKRKNIHFLWVGMMEQGQSLEQIKYDVKQCHLVPGYWHVPLTDTPFDYYAAMDMLVTISREDPFPLVNLECAALGLPILCFEGAGGSAEFVEQDAGFVVPYLDLAEMARRVIQLADKPDLRVALGQKAAAKVQQYDVTAAGPRILAIIRGLLTGSRLSGSQG